MVKIKTLLKLKMIRNKRNGQINMALPKRQLDKLQRHKANFHKNILMRFERFE